jgi:hypothetical protein
LTDAVSEVAPICTAPPSAGNNPAGATEVSVSFETNRRDPANVDPVGAVFNEVETTAESVVPFDNHRTLNVPAVVESARAVVAVPFVFVIATVPTTAACDGTELSTPRPNAATATSAMRLKFVVVDICFLSIVVSKYFLEAALR